MKYLDQQGVSGELAGFCFLLFEGLIGSSVLIILTCLGHGLFNLTVERFLFVALSGLFVTTGLVLQNYALSVGVAGIVFSIVNLSVSI